MGLGVHSETAEHTSAGVWVRLGRVSDLGYHRWSLPPGGTVPLFCFPSTRKETALLFHPSAKNFLPWCQATMDWTSAIMSQTDFSVFKFGRVRKFSPKTESWLIQLNKFSFWINVSIMVLWLYINLPVNAYGEFLWSSQLKKNLPNTNSVPSIGPTDLCYRCQIFIY